MRLGISQRERRAPRATEQLPPLDAQMLPEALHVGDQIPGRIVLERRMRDRAPAAALIEQNDAIAGGIVIAPHRGVAAATRSAMHEKCRLAMRVSALLEVDLVASRYRQATLGIRLDGWVEALAIGSRGAR